jgi:hypothetical protein
MIRSVENWVAIIKDKGGDNVKVARQVLGDLVHYRHGYSHEEEDRQQIVNFMTAVGGLSILRRVGGEGRIGYEDEQSG